MCADDAVTIGHPRLSKEGAACSFRRPDGNMCQWTDFRRRTRAAEAAVIKSEGGMVPRETVIATVAFRLATIVDRIRIAAKRT